MRRSPSVRALTLLVGLSLGITLVIASAGAAGAHVNFVGSTPANVSTVAGPITRITLEYSGAADPIEDDFIIEDSAGASVRIASVDNDGSTKVVVTSTSPLPAGRNKVTWALKGADGHTMTGTIAFTVTSSPASNADSAIAGQTATPDAARDNEPSNLSLEPTASQGFDAAGSVADLARWLVYMASLFVVGAFAYLVWVHRGPRRESRGIVFLVRRGALLIIVGAAAEWFAVLPSYGSGDVISLVTPSAWSAQLSSGFALGTLLRLVGAFLVLRFAAIDVVPEDPIDPSDLDDLSQFAELSESATGRVDVAARRTNSLTRVRVESGRLAFIGAALLIISESFIGHTSSVEPRGLVVVSDAIHMAAAAVWTAGVWLLAWTLWQRSRRGDELDARVLAVKFSLLATWALIAVAITGTALAWAILGSVGALWTTEFGRILLVKVILVAVLGAMGLHNRRTLLPALDSPGSQERFKRTVMAEAVVFVAVLAATSLLVVSNPLP